MKRMFQDPEIQFELAEAFKSILAKPDLVKPLVDLLVETFKDPEVAAGLNGLIESCFHRILLDKDTIDKFRIFVYNLMNMELEDSKGRNSSLLDLMLNKAVARGGSKGQSDIQSIIEKERERGIKEKITTLEKTLGAPEDAFSPDENLDVKEVKSETNNDINTPIRTLSSESFLSDTSGDSDSDSVSDNGKVL